ncbi:hypothetical protein ACHAWF_001454 [Thalassiosira exigua]
MAVRLATTSVLPILLLLSPPCQSFSPGTFGVRALPSTHVGSRSIYRHSLNLAKRGGERDETDGPVGSGEEVARTKSPLELASWYAVEAFGKAFGSKTSSDGAADATSGIDLSKAPSSLAETLKRIQLDNDRSYFLSGDVDRFIYDEDCTFADPFVSFDGRDRFIDNLANLGSLITDYDAKMIKYDVNSEGRQIDTKVMVKLELNLPWKPVLAWPWGVSYAIDPETFLVTSHIESWDIEPLDVRSSVVPLARLFYVLFSTFVNILPILLTPPLLPNLVNFNREPRRSLLVSATGCSSNFSTSNGQNK